MPTFLHHLKVDNFQSWNALQADSLVGVLVVREALYVFTEACFDLKLLFINGSNESRFTSYHFDLTRW